MLLSCCKLINNFCPQFDQIHTQMAVLVDGTVIDLIYEPKKIFLQ